MPLEGLAKLIARNIEGPDYTPKNMPCNNIRANHE